MAAVAAVAAEVATEALGTGPEPPAIPVRAEPKKVLVAEWYFVTASGRNGPVTLDALQQLAVDGQIDDRTLVWKAGMPDWVERARHQEAVQPLVPPESQPAGQSASKWWLWALALAPAWGALLQIFATELWVALTHKHLSYYSQLWWIIVLANCGAAALDFLALKRSGQDVARFGRGMFLLVPVYIYLRDKAHDARFLRFGVWAVSMLVSLSGWVYLNGLYDRLLPR